MAHRESISKLSQTDAELFGQRCAAEEAQAVQAGFDIAGKGATILLFAPSDPDTTIQIDINKLFFKHDRTVTTTYANSPKDLKAALRLISEVSYVERVRG